MCMNDCLYMGTIWLHIDRRWGPNNPYENNRAFAACHTCALIRFQVLFGEVAMTTKMYTLTIVKL